MEQPPNLENLHSSVHDNVQERQKDSTQTPHPATHAGSVPESLSPSIPKSAILADILKTFELQLVQKGLLKPLPQGSSNPLWFLAETERNVFLWRNGHSIADQHQFEFWVDIPELIKKRMKQIENRDFENPFMNPLWGHTAEATPNGQTEQIRLNMSKQEHDYLQAFLAAFSKIESHAHALSYVGTMVLHELGESKRTHVVLPCSAKTARSRDPEKTI